MRKISLEDALILSAARTARRIVHRLPLRVSLSVGRWIGRAIYTYNKRKKVAYQNLKAAFAGEKTPSELKRISKKSFEGLVMAVVELLKFPDFDRAYIEKHVHIIGTEKFQNCLDEKRGLIFLTAHFGNWELLNVAASLLGYPMVALARVQKHPRSDAFLNSLRTSKGSLVIHKGMPVREILRSLRRGKIVGILSDQDGGRNGTFVKFFGRGSSTPSGAATFAMRTNSPVYPVFIFREGSVDHRVEVEGPLRMPGPDVSPEEGERMILQQFAEILEQKIRKSPEQWLWAHRRWKSTPDRSVLILSDRKQGHLNQSLAVLGLIRNERSARGCAPEQTRFAVIDVEYKDPLREKLFRATSTLLLGRLAFKGALLKWVLSEACYRKIIGTYADIVISCGSSLAALNILVKSENNARSVVIMKPPLPTKRFDLVIVSEHDRPKSAKNVFVTRTSPSLITEEYMKKYADQYSGVIGTLNGSKRIGLLVGGDTARLKFSKTYFEDFIRDLGRTSARMDSRILATSSRRTPAWADELLKDVFKDRRRCPLLVIANEYNPEGAVGGILGLSDVIVVSGESMSMVSEAVSSGKPVLVFLPSEEAVLKPKHRYFLDHLEKEGLIARIKPGGIAEILERVGRTPGEQRSPVLADRAVLREAVRKVAV